jgi:hypothetical protein
VKILACKMGLLVIIFNVSVEIPNVYSISFTNTNDLTIISRIENNSTQRISMADEALEEVRNSFLGFIIPNFNHAVLTSS